MGKKQERQDFYAKLAKEEGFPARSVYKLKEIDERLGLFKTGDLVLDLGCSPGSWLLYISKRVGGRGKVVGVDMVDARIPLAGNMVFLKKDVLDKDFLNDGLLRQKYNVVVSDLAPHTSGIKFRDAANSLLLCEKALETARAVLQKRGSFLCKMYEGEKTADFVRTLKNNFKEVKIIRPQATKRASREIYLVAKHFIPCL